ncbi:MAG: hypothetical protein U0792_24345 [Gemmataceae bacterium]
MQRMWRQLFVAAVAVLSLSGIASAQNPIPARGPAVQPAPVPAQAAMGPVTPVAGQIYMRGTGGCSSCGSPQAVNQPGTFGNYGPRDRNGCGSACGDAGRVSCSRACKTFFDPCGGIGGRNHGGCHGGRCPLAARHPVRHQAQ